MNRLARILCLAVAAAVTRPATAGEGELPLPPDRPIDTHFAEDRAVPIEMRSDWDETRRHNITTWSNDLNKVERDRSARDLRLKLRIVRMNDELIRRFNRDRQRHVTALLESADYLGELGLIDARNHRLKRLIDANPGRAELAAEALRAIVEHTPWRQPGRREGAMAWIDYATRRIVALRDAGLIAADHPAVPIAVQTRAEWLIKLDRLGEAHAWVERIADPVVAALRGAELDVAANRPDAAQRRLIAAARRYRDDRLNAPLKALQERTTSPASFAAPPTTPAPIAPSRAIDLAASLLSDGRPGQAERVLRRALRADPPDAIAKRLRVGVWVAMSQQPDRRGDLRRSLDRVDAATAWPWYDGKATVSDLRPRLLAPPTPPAGSGDARPTVVPALVGATHDAHGGRYTSARAFIASDATVIQHEGAVSVVDGRRRTRWQADAQASCVADDRVISRCATGSAPMLIARDVATGRALWRTGELRGRPGWRFAGAPAAADGVAYCVAVSPPGEPANKPVPIALAAFDAATGRALWVSAFGTIVREAMTVGDAAIASGTAITAHAGSVYLLTDAGLAARLDARTGDVDWAVAYRHMNGPTDRPRGTPRHVVEPLVRGSMVLLAPRDRRGMLALDADSGEVRWDAPYDAVDGLVGVSDHHVITHSVHGVASHRLRDGALRWRRTLAGVRCGAVHAGVAQVAVGAQLIRLADDDGRSVDTVSLDAAVAGLADTPGGLVVTVERPVAPAPHRSATVALADATDRPLAAARSPETHAVRLPMSKERPASALLVGPRSAALLRLGASPRIEWRRALPAQPGAITLAPDGVVAVACGRRLVGLDLDTGSSRYDERLSFAADRLLAIGRMIVAVSSGARVMAAVDTATGQRRWQRGLPPGRDLPAAFTRDDQRLYVVDRASLPVDGVWHMVVNPTNSEVERVSKVTHWSAPTWAAALDASRGALLIGQRAVTFTRDRPDKLTVNRHALRELTKERLIGFDLLRDWLMVTMAQPDTDRRVAWVLHRSDTQYLMTLSGASTAVTGNTAVTLDGAQLSLVNLRTKRQAAPYVLPIGRAELGSPVLLAIDRDDRQVSIITGHRTGATTGDVRLHRFTATGERLGTHRLGRLAWRAIAAAGLNGFANDRPLRPTPAAIINRQAVVCDGLEVRVFAVDDQPVAEARLAAAPVYRAPRRLVADGRFDDWSDLPVQRVRHAGRARGAVRLAESAGRLWVGVEAPSRRFSPWQAGDHPLDGDHVRITIRRDGRVDRFTVGIDVQGVTRTEGRLAATAAAAAVHDARASVGYYEVALPRAAFDGAGEADLLVEVFDDELDPHVAAWSWGQRGGGIRVRPRLVGMTPAAFKTATRLAAALPDLPESRSLLRRINHVHAGQGDLLAAFYRDHLKAVGSGDEALRLMVGLDRALRGGLGDDALPLIDRMAEQAGIDTATRKRYVTLAGSLLRQRVQVDAARPPRRMTLSLIDGAGVEHRAVWGGRRDDLADDPAAFWAGPVPTPGEWVDVRLPLVMLGMHDRPITGLDFSQVGGDAVRWGRTMLVIDGREVAMVDDRVPAGRTSGRWAWSGDQRRGTKAHYHERAERDDQRVGHRTFGWLEPVTAHADAAPARPYLAQWVYAEKRRALDSVGLSITPDVGKPLRFAWGPAEAEGAGVDRLGPRPDYDEWVEMRVPLVGTALERRAIRSIAFEQVNGRVRWGATELVVGDRRVALITDGVDGFKAEGDWRWFDEPTNRTKRAHGIDDPAERGRHTAAFTRPIDAHLRPRRDDAIELITEALPPLRASAAEPLFAAALERLRQQRPGERD